MAPADRRKEDISISTANGITYTLRYITRTVWVLSFVSLFTDTASEMLYPVMPMFLRSIGYSVVLIGIIEGVAEATAGVSKGKRVPFVRFGYSLSAISKPLMALFIQPVWILFARTLDRLGKGIRTGARDAILSDEATPATKGKVFGFHRSMDTFGAVLGPVCALLYLYYHPGDYKKLFYIAFAPGVLAVLSSLFLKQKSVIPAGEKKHVLFFSFLHYWKESPVIYKKITVGLLVFTLFNSSDIFLLLKAKESGLTDITVIGVYIFYNLVYALCAFPLGMLADKVGLKKVFVAGLVLFAVVYLGMSATTNLYFVILFFFIYGIYASATEGVAKAWISNVADKRDTATAIGTYSAFQSVCTMLASSLAGLIWWKFGSTATFMLTGVVAAVVCVYFLIGVRYEPVGTK